MLAAAVLLGAGLLSACAPRSEAGVVLAGSTSVQPFAEILAEEYMTARPELVIDVQGGGSSSGILAARTGTAHIGMSSRALKEKEQGLWQVVIARDGMAVVVHPSNPVADLTLDQVRAIYAAEVVDWSELGGPASRIHVIAREEGSGTRSAFEDLVMGESRITPRAIVQDSNGAVRQLVSDDPAAIGFLSMGLVDGTVHALRLDGVAATREHVLDGTYPLSRPFLFVSAAEPTGDARAFLDFVLSKEGQAVLASEGLVPAAEEAS